MMLEASAGFTYCILVGGGGVAWMFENGDVFLEWLQVERG